MVGGAREGSWSGCCCWVAEVGDEQNGSWCLGGTRLCTSTCLPQNHVSRLLPWGAKVRLSTEYFVREVILVLYLHYYTYVHYEVRPMCLP